MMVTHAGTLIIRERKKHKHLNRNKQTKQFKNAIHKGSNSVNAYKRFNPTGYQSGTIWASFHLIKLTLSNSSCGVWISASWVLWDGVRDWPWDWYLWMKGGQRRAKGRRDCNADQVVAPKGCANWDCPQREVLSWVSQPTWQPQKLGWQFFQKSVCDSSQKTVKFILKVG